MKSKMTKEEKTTRRQLLEMFPNAQLFRFDGARVTVAIMPVLDSEKSRHVHVSVALCSSADTFKRKRGELVALQKMYDGEHIAVRWTGVDDLDVVANKVVELVS